MPIHVMSVEGPWVRGERVESAQGSGQVECGSMNKDMPASPASSASSSTSSNSSTTGSEMDPTPIGRELRQVRHQTHLL